MCAWKHEQTRRRSQHWSTLKVSESSLNSKSAHECVSGAIWFVCAVGRRNLMIMLVSVISADTRVHTLIQQLNSTVKWIGIGGYFLIFTLLLKYTCAIIRCIYCFHLFSNFLNAYECFDRVGERNTRAHKHICLGWLLCRVYVCLCARNFCDEQYNTHQYHYSILCHRQHIFVLSIAHLYIHMPITLLLKYIQC